MKKLLFILPLLLIFAWCTTISVSECAELSWAQQQACECARIVCKDIYNDKDTLVCMGICMGRDITWY